MGMVVRAHSARHADVQFQYVNRPWLPLIDKDFAVLCRQLAIARYTNFPRLKSKWSLEQNAGMVAGSPRVERLDADKAKPYRDHRLRALGAACCPLGRTTDQIADCAHRQDIPLPSLSLTRSRRRVHNHSGKALPRVSIANGIISRPLANAPALRCDDWKTVYFCTRTSLGMFKVKIAGVPVPVVSGRIQAIAMMGSCS
jgi:hypothetical protein